MAFASDTFTGSDGTTLASHNANWVRHSGSSASTEVKLFSNTARKQDAAGSCVYYRSESPSSADYEVSADITNDGGGSGDAAGVLGRCSTSASTWYMARLNSGNFQLFKFVSGTATQLGSNVTTGYPTTGNTSNIKLSMSGSSIDMYANGGGSPIISQTDSAISAAGQAGLRFGFGGSDSTDDLRADNFDASDPASGGGSSARVIGGGWGGRVITSDKLRNNDG